MYMDNVVILGSGGREYSFAKYLSKSKKINEIFIIPGNGGSQFIEKCTNIDISIKDFDKIVRFCIERKVELVVIGPEEPLIKGIVDLLQQHDIKCFGPTKYCAQMEGSKCFGKKMMQKCNIANADFEKFCDSKKALEYLKTASNKMRVIKADGIAGGKGVIVAESLTEANDVISNLLNINESKFGDQSLTILIEERLEGTEISLLAFSDGKNVRCFPPSQDHKRAFDGDQGLNTGGMGAYCPCELISPKIIRLIEENIVQKMITFLYSQGIYYQGILYVGLMVTESGPFVLEFNCRFGDPETQVLLPMLKTDLYEVMMACTEVGGLEKLEIEFYNDRYCLCTVMVSGGYPETYTTNYVISGLNDIPSEVEVIHAGTWFDIESNCFRTNGGRVLGLVAFGDELQQCYDRVMEAANLVHYENRFYRSDIGSQAIFQNQKKTLTYANSGVNIYKGDAFVETIKNLSKSGKQNTDSYIGQFGAVFDIHKYGYKDPLLVSGTDGVGTKLKLIFSMDKHENVGQDLVAMCANDVLCHGAKPLFFLDYFATGCLDPSIALRVVTGINKACEKADCVLIGGETAEMPGFYTGNEYDIAGFVVGAVERDSLLPRLDQIQPNDALIGLASSGLHSNGFSLVRKIISSQSFKNQPESVQQFVELNLCVPTEVYVKSVMRLLRNDELKDHVLALSHITGGGLPGNVSRSIPASLQARINMLSWKIPDIFRWLCSQSGSDILDMVQTFNMGVGMVMVVKRGYEKNVCQFLCEDDSVKCLGEIGQLVRKRFTTDYSVVLDNLSAAFDQNTYKNIITSVNGDGSKDVDNLLMVDKRRVGVLISGSGTNLEALLNYERRIGSKCGYKIVVVISNVAGVKGLEVAQKYGVSGYVVDHKQFGKDRRQFEEAVDEIFVKEKCEIICLAGFMRILTNWFTSERWQGRIINIHPSLLPSFRGGHAHRDVLKSGVRVSGATVHFVVEDVDAGGIISQEAVPVLLTDTEETLSQRIKLEVEHNIYPKALDDVSHGHCELTSDNKVIWK